MPQRLLGTWLVLVRADAPWAFEAQVINAFTRTQYTVLFLSTFEHAPPLSFPQAFLCLLQIPRPPGSPQGLQFTATQPFCTDDRPIAPCVHRRADLLGYLGAELQSRTEFRDRVSCILCVFNLPLPSPIVDVRIMIIAIIGSL